MFEGVSITDWLTSIGTVGAVIVSLYLSIKGQSKQGVITYSTIKEKIIENDKEKDVTIYKICFYNTGNKNIYLRKMTVNRLALIGNKKYMHHKYLGNSEFIETVAADSIVEINIDFEDDDKIRHNLGLRTYFLTKVCVEFEDVTGKKYKKYFNLLK